MPHHDHLEILAESLVNVSPAPERDAGESLSWKRCARCRAAGGCADARRGPVYFRFHLHLSLPATLRPMRAESFTPGRPLLAGATELMHRIHDEFRYDTTVTDTSTPVDTVFEIRAGVCQDLAHVGIAMMRSLGLPARYVSGYLLTRPPPRQAAPAGRGCEPRLVQRLRAALRLGRSGPDQCRAGGRRPCHRRLGPRLWRCRAGGGHHSGRA